MAHSKSNMVLTPEAAGLVLVLESCLPAETSHSKPQHQWAPLALLAACRRPYLAGWVRLQCSCANLVASGVAATTKAALRRCPSDCLSASKVLWGPQLPASMTASGNPSRSAEKV